VGRHLDGLAVLTAIVCQVGATALAAVVANLVIRQLLSRVPFQRAEATEGPVLRLRRFVYLCRNLLFPLLTVLALAIAATLCDVVVPCSWVVRLAQSIGVMLVLYAAIDRFIAHPILNAASRCIGIPVAALQVIGYLDDVTLWLDTLAFSAGNIRISAFVLVKAAIFGGVLFWLDRRSTKAGQTVTREQQAIDLQTRELVTKLEQIAVIFIVGILLLNILRLDITALAIFCGALGVGLGFRLQQIASNFISEISILVEWPLKVVDYIELEVGKAGILKEINMRSSALSTFDDREIMVPNEKFNTTRFSNLTKTNSRQHYKARFYVAYHSDIHKVPALIEKAIVKLGAVLKFQGPPSCQLTGFGGWGVNIVARYWVAEIDDGQNSFSSQVYILIWDALQAVRIAMPYLPQTIILARNTILTRNTGKKHHDQTNYLLRIKV